MNALGKIVALVPAASAAVCSPLHQVAVGVSMASLLPGDGQLMLPVVFMGYAGNLRKAWLKCTVSVQVDEIKLECSTGWISSLATDSLDAPLKTHIWWTWAKAHVLANMQKTVFMQPCWCCYKTTFYTIQGVVKYLRCAEICLMVLIPFTLVADVTFLQRCHHVISPQAELVHYFVTLKTSKLLF